VRVDLANKFPAARVIGLDERYCPSQRALVTRQKAFGEAVGGGGSHGLRG
jgi:hypothetical protein